MKSANPMKICQKCLLPENYPGITFNEKGVCNFCTDYKEQSYQGEFALTKEIEKFLYMKKNRNNKYDCIIGFSGGRDSSYLLYFLRKKLNLRVLAYTADNGILPEKTRDNIKNITDILNIESVFETNDLLKKCFKHTISSWMAKPSLVMTESLCTGCRLGIFRGVYRCAKNKNIPIIILGATPFEQVTYRENLMKVNSKGGAFSRILGYSSQILKNPRWLMNFNYLDTQIKEYVYFYYYEKIIRHSGMLPIAPFYNYIRWDEQRIISTITQELNWQKEGNVVSTWRADCKLALLKLYIQKKVFGYNDKLPHLSNLIRDKQINREDALKRLEKEETISEDVVRGIVEELNIPHADFYKALEKIIIK